MMQNCPGPLGTPSARLPRKPLYATNDYLLLRRLALVEFRGGRYIWYRSTLPTEAEKMSFACRVAKLLSITVLRAMPPRPEYGKWTKDAPAIDWFVALFVFFNLIGYLELAYKGMKIHIMDAGQTINALGFHQSQGVRLHDSKALARSAHACLTLKVLHFTCKATRYLTEYFLKSSRDVHAYSQHNSAMDFQLPQQSHATVCMQYLGFLGSGDAAAELCVIWERSGFIIPTT